MTTATINHVRQAFWIEKVVINKWFWLIFCSLAFSFPLIRAINRDLPAPPPVLFQLPEYQFLNENGQAFGSKDLKGKVYIANFMFTSCPTTCPRLMEKMQLAQKRVKGLGTKVAIVSFTVDPENDNAKVLFKHARDYKANPFVWTFLTGEHDQLHSLLIDGFKVPMGEKENISGMVDGESVSMFDIAHTEKMVLVDGNGGIRGYYSTDDDGMNRMMIDVGLLVNLKDL